MTTTPAMCHQAETVLSRFSTGRPKRLIAEVQQDDRRVDDEDVLLRQRHVEPEVEERRDEGRRAVVDRRGHGDLADQVEPAREPAPPRAAELGGPVVEAAGRRHRRGDLRHRERDDGAEAADQQPAPRDGDRPAVVERDEIGRQAAREDRDDREGDREVAEAAHGPIELLGVAEFVQELLVLVQLMPRAGGAGRVQCP